jgi:hypothetical protein
VNIGSLQLTNLGPANDLRSRTDPKSTEFRITLKIKKFSGAKWTVHMPVKPDLRFVAHQRHEAEAAEHFVLELAIFAHDADHLLATRRADGDQQTPALR